MSRQVYQLNNPDDEDYLSFGQSTPEVPVPTTAPRPRKMAPVVQKKSPAPRIIRDKPTIAEPDEEMVTIPVDDKPNTGKKIPLKSVAEHQTLINQLNAYASSVRFASVLKECDIKIKDLRSKSLPELRELRERVRSCCANSGGTGGIISSSVLSACSAAEKFTPKRLMDLDGYRAEVEKNPEFSALCEMIEIDSNFRSSMSPMQRLALCLGQTALGVSGANKMKSIAQAANTNLIANLRAEQAQVAQQTAITAPVPEAKVAIPVPSTDGMRIY